MKFLVVIRFSFDRGTTPIGLQKFFDILAGIKCFLLLDKEEHFLMYIGGGGDLSEQAKSMLETS
jgi:hypothetical protein